MTATPTCLVANQEQSEQNDGDNAAWCDNSHPHSQWDGDTERWRCQQPGCPVARQGYLGREDVLILSLAYLILIICAKYHWRCMTIGYGAVTYCGPRPSEDALTDLLETCWQC